MTTRWLLTLAATSVLAACGNVETSSLATETPDYRMGIPELSRGINHFTFDLYGDLAKEAGDSGSNLFLSPASVSTAFAMTYVGARGQTAHDMASVLGYHAQPTAIGADFNALLGALAADKQDDGYQLTIANRIWAQKDFGFLADFERVNRDDFKSPIGKVDFTDQTAREAVVAEINQWASDHTNAKITDIVTKEDVHAGTRIMLANAIYFLGDWVYPFQNPGDQFDRSAPFHRIGAEPVDVTFMTHADPLASVSYYEDEQVQAVELPYKAKNNGSELAMTIILPKASDGLADLEQTMTEQRFEAIVQGMRTIGYKSMDRLSIKLPKWELKSDVMKLKEPLERMGLGRAFTPYDAVSGEGADFSGMTGKPNIVLDKVLHKTFIRVDEKGTEAAAVTVIGGAEATSVRPHYNIVPFVADHPFLYAIRNVKTDTILFIGRLMDPSVNK